MEAMLQNIVQEATEQSSYHYITLLNKYNVDIDSLLREAYSALEKIEAMALLEEQSIEQSLSSWEKYWNDQGKNITPAQRLYRKNYLKAKKAISNAANNIQKKKQNQKIEQIMRSGYKIIDELRTVTTGQPTTFTVLVNIGTKSQKMLMEVKLPLEEILSVGKISADFHGGKTIANALKMRLSPSKSQQKKWVEKYSGENITDIYTTFEEETDNFLGIVGAGRQYEFFKKGTDSNYLAESTWEELAQVARDTTSFVKGVDYIFEDEETGEKSYESLKSFLGGDPSLANLSTIITTLESIQTAIIGARTFIQGEIAQQLNNTINIVDTQKMLQSAIEDRLKEIFPFA